MTEAVDPLDRLYIVTRRDLPVGLQAAQAAHAAFQFARDHWDCVAPWLRDSNFIVLVTVEDERALTRLLTDSGGRLHYAAVREPDLQDALTAVALQPGEDARRICGSLPLLGRGLWAPDLGERITPAEFESGTVGAWARAGP